MVFDLRSISEGEEHIRMVKFYDMDVDEMVGDEEQEIPLHGYLCRPAGRR